MGCLGAGFLGDRGRPVLALPIDQVIGQLARILFHAFPPHVAVVGQRHVREDHVLVEALHAVGVGVVVGTGRHAEVAGLGVDGAQAAVGLGLDPGDVVPDGRDLPAVEGRGRNEHREVGLATGAGEGCGHVVFLAVGLGHAQDQHVLGQPALVAAHGRGNAQREALLAQQRIAAVTRAVGPDLARLGVMDDVLGLVAGPGGLVLFAVLERRADGVHAGHELAGFTDHVIHGAAHARHEFHVDGHIGAVGQFHAHMGDGRAERAHGERNHVHGAACHAAVKQRL